MSAVEAGRPERARDRTEEEEGGRVERGAGRAGGEDGQGRRERARLLVFEAQARQRNARTDGCCGDGIHEERIPRTSANVCVVEFSKARDVIPQLSANTDISALAFYTCRNVKGGEELQPTLDGADAPDEVTSDTHDADRDLYRPLVRNKSPSPSYERLVTHVLKTLCAGTRHGFSIDEILEEMTIYAAKARVNLVSKEELVPMVRRTDSSYIS